MIVTSRETLKVAKDIVQSSLETYLAVSYWSGGATAALDLEGQNVRVVLDVYSGGTCPRELTNLVEAIGRENVKIHPDLHAKIYANRELAMIGSANATRPGLQILPSDRVEVSVKVTGQNANAAFGTAKAIFNDDDSENYRTEHLEICRQRFGRKTLAHAEAGLPENMGLLDAILAKHESLSHFPLIITTGEVERIEAEEAYQEVRDEIDPPDLDEALWDDYNFELEDEYMEKPCLVLHAPGKHRVFASFVSPRYRTDLHGAWSFAKRLDWRELPVGNFQGVTQREFEAIPDRDTLRDAILETQELDDNFLRVSDLYNALG